MRTPLYDEHLKLGARIIDFHGWELPIHYELGIIKEHHNVRNSVGLFDVSHMGQIIVEGSDAPGELQRLCTNNIIDSKPGQAVYTHMLDEEGNIIDDMIVFRIAKDKILVVPNATTTEKVDIWMRKQMLTEINNLSDDMTCLAVQGPKSIDVMRRVFGSEIDNIQRFAGKVFNRLDNQSFTNQIINGSDSQSSTSHIVNRLDGQSSTNQIDDRLDSQSNYTTTTNFPELNTIFVSRTGYTGEEGFELFFHNDLAVELWNMILEAEPTHEISPIGLGARDTLRLEMGYLLSGQDFNGSQSPLESAGAWVIKWDHDFIGKDKLRAQKEKKTHDKLVGIHLESKLAARTDSPIFAANPQEPKSPVEIKGLVTSGNFSPTLGYAIALARVKREFAKPDIEVEIEYKGRRLKGVTTKPPFVKKPKG